MKVTEIRATPVALPFRQTFHWHSGAQLGVNLVLFTVETDEGVRGYGESIGEHPDAVAAYGRMLTDAFVGRSPGDVEAALQQIYTRGRFRTTRRFVNQVVAGIEMACWDAYGKALGVPARAFLGGTVRPAVDHFGFVQGGTAVELSQHARELTEAGFDIIFVKVGRKRLDEDVEIVAAVREAIGPKHPLRVDPNEAWDVPTAIDQIRRLEPFGIDWVEQPVSADNVPALAAVRRATSTKVAADQAVYSTGELRHVLDLEAADVVVLGIHEAGGLWRLRQQAYLAEAHGIPVNRHGNLESSISTFAALQVAASIPNLTSGNQVMHHLLAEQLTTAPVLEFEGGKLHVPDGPGLGFELDGDAVTRAAERYVRDGPYRGY